LHFGRPSVSGRVSKLLDDFGGFFGRERHDVISDVVSRSGVPSAHPDRRAPSAGRFGQQ
jgi:hypothetical protein